MRHRVSGRKFSRSSAHRKALLAHLANSLLTHEIIKTTLPKAKSLRPVVEKLITIAKEDSTANRRLLFARLRDKAVVTKLFEKIGPLFKARPGGYVRILKCGYRVGDNAPMAYIEFVEKTPELIEAA